jgi:hypothetical protein
MTQNAQACVAQCLISQAKKNALVLEASLSACGNSP